MNKLSGENEKFAANNKAFEAQVTQMSGENEKFAESNKQLSEQVEQMKAEIEKMSAENEKFAENNKQLTEQVSTCVYGGSRKPFGAMCLTLCAMQDTQGHPSRTSGLFRRGGVLENRILMLFL